MTDNEIIKAMQCVIGNNISCSECRYQKVLPFPSCRRMCAKNALDLINRQKTEIERLEKEKDSKLVMCIANDIRKAKSEAIKEFAESICNGRVSNDPVVIAVRTELECMKEMTEVENEDN